MKIVKVILNIFQPKNDRQEDKVQEDGPNTEKTRNHSIASTAHFTTREIRRVSLIPWLRKASKEGSNSTGRNSTGRSRQTSEKSVNSRERSIIRDQRIKTKQSTNKDRVKFLKKNQILFQDEIDSGAFSNIYKGIMIDNARSKNKSKNEVAIKRINLQAPQNKKFLAKFLEREVLVHSKIKHKHIVEYYDTILNEPYDIYLIIEWQPRGNLLDYCRLHGRLKESIAQKILYQICLGLSYLHANQIVHRDIKCENILVSETDPTLFIKVADFGFARFIGKSSFKNHSGKKSITEALKSIKSSEIVLEVSQQYLYTTVEHVKSSLSSLSHAMSNCTNVKCKTFCGSLAYSSPELVQGNSYDGRKVDVWSTGCIAFILLTHRMPYKERYGNAALLDQQCQPLRWPQYISNNLSPEAKDFVESMLIYNPDFRPFLTTSMMHEWLRDTTTEEMMSKRSLDKFSRRGSVSANCILQST